MNFPPLFTPDEVDLQRYGHPILPQAEVVDPIGVLRDEFPRIAERIELMWGSPELQEYLSSLIMDNRHYATGQHRQGFPAPVIDALLKLYQRHTNAMTLHPDDKWHNAM